MVSDNYLENLRLRWELFVQLRIASFMVLPTVIETVIISYQDIVIPLNYRSENVRGAILPLPLWLQGASRAFLQHTYLSRIDRPLHMGGALVPKTYRTYHLRFQKMVVEYIQN